jgi:hypothetical protein
MVFSKKLYGDDSNVEHILQWYRVKEKGYANFGSYNNEKYSYQ